MLIHMSLKPDYVKSGSLILGLLKPDNQKWACLKPDYMKPDHTSSAIRSSKLDHIKFNC